MNHISMGRNISVQLTVLLRVSMPGSFDARTPFYSARSQPPATRLHRTQGKRNQSGNKLGLGPRAARMRAVGVATKLDLLIRRQLHRLLELLANLHQSLLSRAIPALALTHRPRPQADAEEGLAHVDDDAHDLVVVVFLEGFADGGQLGVEPQFVDVDALLVFELVGPFAAVLVL
jgi:hypothetical protein